MQKLFEYRGHLHIHSTFSDGAGSVPQIIAAAQEAGLDFIGITDHNTLATRESGLEGKHGDVLVIAGMEINENKNHYIAFDIDQHIPANDDNPADVIAAVKEQGGFGYLAHPVEKSNPAFLEGRCYPWDRWDLSDFNGMEIWNFCSLWRGVYRKRWHALFWYFADPYRAVRFPEADGLALWDRLSKDRPVNAFVGSDAHALTVQAGPFKLVFFPYRFLFRSFNVHVLLPAELEQGFHAARSQVLAALRGGNFFCCSDYMKPGRGFRFSSFNERHGEVLMGGKIPFTQDTVLRIKTPHPRSMIRIIKNGSLVYQNDQACINFKVLSPGTFRVEVYHPRTLFRPALPWIYSNPVYVTGGGKQGERSQKSGDRSQNKRY